MTHVVSESSSDGRLAKTFRKHVSVRAILPLATCLDFIDELCSPHSIRRPNTMIRSAHFLVSASFHSRFSSVKATICAG
jgi:hypothetical protein